MTKEYLVKWQIQISASSPEEAAKAVWEEFIFHGANSLGEATNLDVFDAEEAIGSDTNIGYLDSFDMGENDG